MAGDDYHVGDQFLSVLTVIFHGFLLGSICGDIVCCIAVCCRNCRKTHYPDSPRVDVVSVYGSQNVATEYKINSSAVLITVSKERNEVTCSGCQLDFNEGDPVRALPVCSHVFHIACIDTWLLSHPNCSVCEANTLPIADVALSVPKIV
ncbi:RING-H2 finger protein ATL65 [Linum perenne]